MRFTNTLRVALRALRRNTLRSILTALGIIIGVGESLGGLFLGESLGQIGIFLIFFLHGMGLSTESLLSGASRWRISGLSASAELRMANRTR